MLRCVALRCALAVVSVPATSNTQAGATLPLTYSGQIDGLEAAAIVSFEDVRLVTSGGGFVLIGGSPAWSRVFAFSGRIYLGAAILTSTAGYSLNGTVENRSNGGFADAVALHASERFLVRLDFPSDADFIAASSASIDSPAVNQPPAGPAGWFHRAIVRLELSGLEILSEFLNYGDCYLREPALSTL